MKSRLTSNSISVRLLSLAFAVWLAGVGCLTGCARTLIVADQLSNSDVCCHKTTKSELAATDYVLQPSTMPVCCPLAGLAGAVTTKQRDREITVAQPVSAFALIDTIATEESGLSTKQIRLADRHGTYLRNCTFRI